MYVIVSTNPNPNYEWQLIMPTSTNFLQPCFFCDNILYNGTKMDVIFRVKAHRKKLPATVAELPPAGRQTGQYHGGGAPFDYRAAC